MKKTLLLTVAIAWMGIGNVWNESVIAQEEAVPVGATESEEGAIRKTKQGAPPGVPKEAPVSPADPPRPSRGGFSPYATEAESHPGTPSDPTSPQMLAIDQVIDRAAALRKQAIRAKLRGYEDEARRLWLQAEDASKEIEQHMRARHPGVQPLGLGSSPPRQPPAPDAVPRKLRRVTPTEARPGVRSAAPGSKPRKLRRVTPSTEARPGVRSAAPGSKPRKLRRVTPREVSPEPRVRSARPENSRTHASGKEVWEEIEHLRGEVRELRELLKKALRERKTRASFAF